MQHQFQVTGMTCGHCERAVVHAVRSIDEEALVKVDRELDDLFSKESELF